MTWCEANKVDFVFVFARNTRLELLLEPFMMLAHTQQTATGHAAHVFAEFDYETTSGSWSRSRRVIGKAEVLGDKENRIKEQLSLFADRVSTETMRANQMRVYFSGMAYVLLSALRRIGLQGTEMARAQATTIRLRLLKIDAQVRITARRVRV